MKIAIIILAHKNQKQFTRLVNHLKNDFDLYINIDKRSKLELESFENVFVCKEHRVEHGVISLVTSTIAMLQEAFKKKLR